MTLADEVSFYVAGTPVPQGSKDLIQRVGKAWMIDRNKTALDNWRARVANEADRGIEFDAPVVVTLRFVLARPKNPRWVVPAVRPDADKLARAVLDGLKDGGLLADDSRVVELHVTKTYVLPGDVTGVQINVEAY